MRLNVRAFAFSAGILWALAVFITGVANLMWAGYGDAFLGIVASIYPGYHSERSFGDILVGTLYALADGTVCGLVFCWVYNLFVGKK
jgi:hypothetical protein